MNMRKFVSTRLAELRGEMTQAVLAKKAGISQATVQRILVNEQTPTVEVLAALATALNVHPATFLLNPREAKLLMTYFDLSENDKINILSYIEFQHSKNTNEIDKLNSHSVSLSSNVAAVSRANAKGLTDEADESTKLSRRR
jgi:transcriptional regulator with XRE-family HTH domain